ncbi:MAG TPA: hypothetical protein VF717_04935 [Pyrinomonadaceae bacterium]|jgi:hypothetical protein
MKYKLSTALLLVLFASAPGYADLIGNFDGLDNLIARSDAILITRIEENVEAGISFGFPTTQLCRVFKTLKGDIPDGSRIPLRLRDTTDYSVPEKFRVLSVHVVFLIKQPPDKDGIEYHSVPYEGANIEISPLFNEKVLKGNSIKENIKLLVQGYIEYRNKVLKREDILIEKILKS